ncbi:MAG: ABC transporter permease, partial [Terriglobales bacterium]
MRIRHDFVYALRRLRRAPGFTAVAVAVMALGIGANTAIFSVVNAALLAPLPYRHPQQLVALYETQQSPGNFPVSGPDFRDWQRQASRLQGMSLYRCPIGFNLGGSGEPQHLRGAQVEANFFQLLGVRAALGRTFLRGEDTRGKTDVALLSYNFWRSQFGTNADVVGKNVVLNGRKYAVVGVLPASFRWQPQTQIWVPLNLDALGPRGYYSFSAVARLRPGVALAAAQAQLSGIAARLARRYPASNHDVGARIVPLRTSFVAVPLRASLWALLAVVGLVLLIACADLANMLLARSTGRRQEIAIRRALGASGRRIAAQLLTESVLLAAAGAVVGATCAWTALRLASGLPGLHLPGTAVVAVDTHALAFTAAIAVASGILFGFAPVWQLRSSTLQRELHQGASARRGWLGNSLVIAEVALGLVLVVLAGLLLESLQRMQSRPLGIQPVHLLTMEVPLSSSGTLLAVESIQNEFVKRMAAQPGIAAASFASELPLEGGHHNGYPVIVGQSTASRILIEDARVSASYLEATQLPLLAGSWYNPAQVQAWQQIAPAKWALPPSPQRTAALAHVNLAVVVNQAFAHDFFPGGAIGKRFRDDKYSPWMRIQGIVGNVPILGPRQVVPMPEAYYPVFSGPYLLVRSRLPVAAVVADA